MIKRSLRQQNNKWEKGETKQGKKLLYKLPINGIMIFKSTDQILESEDNLKM